ncbi:hypothetical protein EGC86_10135 [Shewanella frigidimarina]|uniref:hypothetical protein n=1 Tax=Shewanella frigidimarina TaxID=56812 RepID=UPI000F4D6401|nr:hypothetical protein [Shewanella frigidimarina]RPA61418.1 hypothetical protein EGC86_10135 [Shewanella frigidimarina]
MSAKNSEVKPHHVGVGIIRAQTTQRPKKVAIRIPENYIGLVKQLVNYLDELTMVNGHKVQVESEKVLVNSIQHKAQEIIFKALISK